MTNRQKKTRLKAYGGQKLNNYNSEQLLMNFMQIISLIMYDACDAA